MASAIASWAAQARARTQAQAQAQQAQANRVAQGGYMARAFKRPVAGPLTISAPAILTTMTSMLPKPSGVIPQPDVLPPVQGPVGGSTLTPGPSAQAAYAEADGIAAETSDTPTRAGLSPMMMLVIGLGLFLALGKKGR